MVLDKTLYWLSKWTFMPSLTMRDILYMRKQGDYTPDDELKESWYMNMSEEDKLRLVCIFDDRNKVVEMWRRLGLTCLQVAKGDF